MSSFSLLLALGTLAGLTWVALQPSRDSLAQLNAATWGLAGSLLGGRAVYVALHWSYYHSQMLEIPQPWLGGLSGPGALAGALAGVAAYVLLTGWRTAVQRYAHLADALVPLLACLAAAAWLGCWQEGTAYGAAYGGALDPGRAADHPWYMLSSPDEWGRSLPRLPLQPAAALLSLVAAWLAEVLATRLTAGLAARRAPGFYTHTSHHHKATHMPGLRAALSLLLLALAWLPVSWLRADPVPVWNNQPLDLWFYLLLAGFAAAWTGMALRPQLPKWRNKYFMRRMYAPNPDPGHGSD